MDDNIKWLCGLRPLYASSIFSDSMSVTAVRFFFAGATLDCMLFTRGEIAECLVLSFLLLQIYTNRCNRLDSVYLSSNACSSSALRLEIKKRKVRGQGQPDKRSLVVDRPRQPLRSVCALRVSLHALSIIICEWDSTVRIGLCPTESWKFLCTG